MNERSLASRFGVVVVAAAVAVVLVALAILPFMNPLWIGFEQDRAGAARLTGYTADEVRAATDSILADLVLGPPDFDVAVRGTPVLTAGERAHMRDVRGVFAGFFGVAGLGLLIVAGAFWLGGRSGRRRRDAWVAVRAGAAGLAIAAAATGIVAAVAFDPAFEVFHRLFFAAGTYNFDPATARLIQLLPDQFWSDTALAVGAVILILSLAAFRLAGWSLGRLREAGPAVTDGGDAIAPLSRRGAAGRDPVR